VRNTSKKSGMADSNSTEKWVICPGCNGPSLFAPSNIYRPFCCERCKNKDFSAWASEAFRVAADAPPEDLPFGDPKLVN